MHIDYWNQKRFIFHYKFINIWHHICFLWSIDAHDVSTTSIRGDVWGCDVMWRDVTWRRSYRLKQDQDQTSWTFFETDGPSGLNDVNDILKYSQIAALYIFVYLKQKEKEWLIDYLYFILWYLILITLIRFFKFPVKNIEYFWKDCVSYQ